MDFQSFDIKRTRGRLFQKHIVRTKVDIYILVRTIKSSQTF
jgi:hypothetical protein